MQQIKIFSPASVSNVCCGFDVLGFSIEGIGDELIISKSKFSGVKIKKVNGYDVPNDELKNTASIAGNALLDLEIINSSPKLSIANPRTSNPQQIFETVAGEKIFICCIIKIIL